ncbi:MAG: radical SAM protein [Proteobacteria bacterium]|nr:radical SAM protein [Pseudomonadota bacterium]MBU1581697.1 radical SAM protein [Pseudomonadota bacterium]MBU2631721.1 radical SAM protein [Pseudomonadota bacterium]
MSVGIVLVHGYTGSDQDLAFLFEKLCSYYGSDSVINTSLPFHDRDKAPKFDQDAFEQVILKAVNCFKEKKKKLVLVGFSTGGTLLLSCLRKHSIIPDLLVLAGVPKQIDTGYIQRWATHCTGKPQPDFSSIARMISVINSMGKIKFKNRFFVLIMNGETDELVLKEEAFKWAENFKGEKRIAIIPDAGHHVFKDISKQDMASDIIVRTVFDLTNRVRKESNQVLERLAEIEPRVKSFLLNSPTSRFHLSQCPGGKRLQDGKPDFSETVSWAPVFANIEITTQCNLKCRFCARTRLGIKGKDMAISLYSRILELLPHAYRITLVGLGEPLLHPEIIEFVKIAVSRKRRVALVTNASNLDPAMSEKLINAGLDSIAFSIDGPDQILSGKLRYGTDLKKVIDHIQQFTVLADAFDKQISKAVFSAVSIISLPYLEQLIDLVSGLGVNVLMLSDLNFSYNGKDCLHQNMDKEKIAILRKAIAHSFSKNLPVLSVYGLEEFGLRHRYLQFLAAPPSKIYERPKLHTHCLSPWQTLPVNVNGEVLICDCQPDKRIGNLFSDSFSNIWNGRIMKQHRSKMTGPVPPDACRICPRF